MHCNDPDRSCRSRAGQEGARPYPTESAVPKLRNAETSEQRPPLRTGPLDNAGEGTGSKHLGVRIGPMAARPHNVDDLRRHRVELRLEELFEPPAPRLGEACGATARQAAYANTRSARTRRRGRPTPSATPAATCTVSVHLLDRILPDMVEAGGRAHVAVMASCHARTRVACHNPYGHAALRRAKAGPDVFP